MKTAKRAPGQDEGFTVLKFEGTEVNDIMRPSMVWNEDTKQYEEVPVEGFLPRQNVWDRN